MKRTSLPLQRREFITLLGGAAASVVWPLPLGAHWGGKTPNLGVSLAEAPINVAAQQTTGRIPRIGYLTLSPISDKPSPERTAFLRGLRELGYIESETIQIEYSSAESYVELLPEAAKALVEQGVDLIAATGVVPALAAKQATSNHPGGFHICLRPGGERTGRQPR